MKVQIENVISFLVKENDSNFLREVNKKGGMYVLHSPFFVCYNIGITIYPWTL